MVRIEFSTDNEAFTDYPLHEVARTLRILANQIINGSTKETIRT